MIHTDYENHVRMKKDYTITGINGSAINLKAGEVIDTNTNIDPSTIQAFLNPDVNLATDNPDEHLIFKGDYHEEHRYYTPEVTNFNGSQWKCINDTPSPCGAFDVTHWELKVKGVDHIDPV